MKLLGRLDFIAHRANFLMWPVLGVVDSGALARMVPSPAEVGEVFFVPLSHLLAAKPIEYSYELVPAPAEHFPYALLGIPRDYKWQNGTENVPVYPWQGRAIWGGGEGQERRRQDQQLPSGAAGQEELQHAPGDGPQTAGPEEDYRGAHLSTPCPPPPGRR